MSRIDETFARLRRDQATGLVAYMTAGHPDQRRSAGVLRAIARGGADVIEVGVPFSDPLADGPVIQRASERALAAGATLSTTLDMIGAARADVACPLVLFTYANPVYRMGLASFAARAAAAGVDGVLALDVPMEEAGELRSELTARNIDPIFLLSPTTSPDRMALAGQLGRGFLYVISRLGVTGARSSVASGARELVSRVRSHASLPVALGFGISSPEHVREAGRWADAVVVGSALVQAIDDAADAPDFDERIARYVEWLRGAGPAPVADDGGRR
jgi:tryptophan synthase alpha chain